MKPQGAEEDHVKLKAFSFTLKGVTEEWFFPCLLVQLGTGMNKKNIS
jgi:hypothetical protein